MPITCQELVELVTDRFEGALAERERAAFDAHVAACPGCRAYLRQMRATLRLTRETRALEPLPEVAALVHAFRDWHSGAR